MHREAGFKLRDIGIQSNHPAAAAPACRNASTSATSAPLALLLPFKKRTEVKHRCLSLQLGWVTRTYFWRRFVPLKIPRHHELMDSPSTLFEVIFATLSLSQIPCFI